MLTSLFRLNFCHIDICFLGPDLKPKELACQVLMAETEINSSWALNKKIYYSKTCDLKSQILGQNHSICHTFIFNLCVLLFIFLKAGLKKTSFIIEIL